MALTACVRAAVSASRRSSTAASAAAARAWSLPAPAVRGAACCGSQWWMPAVAGPSTAAAPAHTRWFATKGAPAVPAKKRKKAWVIKKRSGPTYPIMQSLRLVQAFATTSTFDETVDVVVQLGVDPRKPNQNIRGIVELPHGTGANVVVAVFAKGPNAEAARAAGATIVGGEDLVERVTSGKIDFTVCIATPDMMPLVGRVARILGPRGLMPNPKLGTITTNVTDAVQAALRGQVEFRTDKRGTIRCGIGKASWDVDTLRDNLRGLMVALGNAKPAELKGQYFRHVILSSTVGRAVPVDAALLDPSNARFMQSDEDALRRTG